MTLCRGWAGHQSLLSLHCMPAPGWQMLIKATWGLHKAGPGTGCEARLAGPAGHPKSFESWGWRPMVSRLGWMLALEIAPGGSRLGFGAAPMCWGSVALMGL